MTEPLLLLASASPARTRLLTDAGIAHGILVSNVDEDAVAAANGRAKPHETALVLARAKAEAVAALPRAAGHVVLGCDSVFELDGRPYGKPHTEEVARERIGRMSGRAGVLHTGHWLVDRRDHEQGGTGIATGAITSASVHFDVMEPAEIDAYVASGEPLKVAGSFTLDGLGGAFITRIEGDPHTVVGLSISTLRGLLRQLSVPITSLWATGTHCL